MRSCRGRFPVQLLSSAVQPSHRLRAGRKRRPRRPRCDALSPRGQSAALRATARSSCRWSGISRRSTVAVSKPPSPRSCRRSTTEAALFAGRMTARAMRGPFHFIWGYVSLLRLFGSAFEAVRPSHYASSDVLEPQLSPRGHQEMHGPRGGSQQGCRWSPRCRREAVPAGTVTASRAMAACRTQRRMSEAQVTGLLRCRHKWRREAGSLTPSLGRSVPTGHWSGRSETLFLWAVPAGTAPRRAVRRDVNCRSMICRREVCQAYE